MLICVTSAGLMHVFCNIWRFLDLFPTCFSMIPSNFFSCVIVTWIKSCYYVRTNRLNSLYLTFISFLSCQSLDKGCLGPLRKAYCHSLNLLLRREVCTCISLMANRFSELDLQEVLTLFPFVIWYDFWNICIGTWICKWTSCKHQSSKKSYCLAWRICWF